MSYLTFVLCMVGMFSAVGGVGFIWLIHKERYFVATAWVIVLMGFLDLALPRAF